MSFGGWREVTTNVSGDAAEYGCNDIKLVSQLLNGTTVPAVKIASTNGFYFMDSALRFRNPLDNQTLTIRTPAITSSLQLSIPVITVNDIIAVVNLPQTLKGKILDSSCNVSAAVGASGTPSAHATTHKSGGTDVIKLDEFAATTDITALNASTTAHGLLPKLSNVSTQFLSGVGTWLVPAGGGGTGAPDITGVVYIATDGSGDYTTIAAAIAAQGGSKQYKLAPGTHSLSAQLIPALSNVSIDGSGIHNTTISFENAMGATGAGINWAGSVGAFSNFITNTVKGNKIVTINTTGFAANDWVYVKRNVNMQTGIGASDFYDAEIHKIATIDSSSQMTLDQPLYADYNTANTATMAKITWCDGLAIRNLTIKDNRSDYVTSLPEQGDTVLTFCRNVVLDNVRFLNGVFSELTIKHCWNVECNNTQFDAPRSISSTATTRYGVHIVGASTHVNFTGGWGNRCRHTIDTDMNGGTGTNAGRPRNITIMGMKSYDCDSAHFNSHQGTVGITFIGCGAIGGHLASEPGHDNEILGFGTRSPATYLGCYVLGAFAQAWDIYTDDPALPVGTENTPHGDKTTLIGCRIQSVVEDASDTGRGVRISTNRQGVVIQGLMCEGIPDQVIELQNGASKVSISECVFSNCGVDIGSGSGLIRITGTSNDVTVDKCVFDAGTPSPAGTPLYVQGVVNGLRFTNNTVRGLTNKKPIISATSTDVEISGNIGLSPLGKITSPINTSTNTIGSYGGTTSTPIASVDYTVVGGTQIIFVSGGTGVSMTIKDGVGNVMDSGIATNVQRTLPNGYKINFGGFSSAPTILVGSY